MNINVSDKLIYLGAGCGIGLVIGFLLAPESGEEMRHTLTSKVDEAAGQTWRNVVEKGKNIANIGKARLNESVEAGKRRFSESIEGDDLIER